jgi:Gram-negative porin
MRKFLLASVATLGTTGGLMGAALAQTPPGAPVPQPPMSAPVPISGPIGAPSQGQQAWPAAPAPVAYVNSNNNYQAPMLPGALANPTPGTIVVHINAKVQVDVGAMWTSADQRAFTAPSGAPGAAPITSIGSGPLALSTATSASTAQTSILGVNGTGTAKLQPQAIGSFARLYFGGDGMATNGLRYGAAIEVRENFSGEQSGSSASTYASLETIYIRRAFTYVAGDNWGIVRLGQADGPIGIFDNGVTTFQFLPTGNFNGGDSQSFMPGAVPPTFIWLSQAGGEYDTSKIVYLSPQIAGFDFGFMYAPSTSNQYGTDNAALGALGQSITGAGIGTGLTCATATSGCPNLSSGPGSLDGDRLINIYAAGLRYQGAFGALGVLAYGVYMGSGTVDYTGLGPATAAGRTILGTSALPGSKYNGKFTGWSLGSGGVAVTYAGFTVGGNVIGGAKNAYASPMPQGAVHQLGYILGAKYVYGPWTVGIAAMEYWDQGNVQMTGLTQHRARGINPGFSYTVAPGYTVYAEYMWNDQTQNGVNQITGATNSGANNNIRGQGFVIGNVVNF